MSPVEGCPTVFQVIYNLPPGYHQVSLWLCYQLMVRVLRLMFCGF